ncbi:hypothetical protein HYS54_05285 [Candidatus Micrarchaeota archaeon]|nr:hypothetical protein [Candidatus Micrarchaeota archaeon]
MEHPKDNVTQNVKRSLARSPRRLGVQLDRLLAERLATTRNAMIRAGIPFRFETRSPAQAIENLKKRAKRDPKAKAFLERLTMHELARVEGVKERLFPEERVPGVVYVQAKVGPPHFEGIGVMPKKEVRQWLHESVKSGLIIPWKRGSYLIPMQTPVFSVRSIATYDGDFHRRSFYTSTPGSDTRVIKGTGDRSIEPHQYDKDKKVDRLWTLLSFTPEEHSEERMLWGGAQWQTTLRSVMVARKIRGKFTQLKDKDPVIKRLSELGLCNDAPVLKPGAIFKPRQTIFYTGGSSEESLKLLLANRRAWNNDLTERERGLVRGVFRQMIKFRPSIEDKLKAEPDYNKLDELGRYRRILAMIEQRKIGRIKPIQASGISERLASEPLNAESMPEEEFYDLARRKHLLITNVLGPEITLRLRKGAKFSGIPAPYRREQVVYGYSLPNGLGKRVGEVLLKDDIANIVKAYGLKKDTPETRERIALGFGARMLLVRELVRENLKGRLGSEDQGWPVSPHNATPTHFVDLDTVDFKKPVSQQEAIREDQEMRETFDLFCKQLKLDQRAGELWNRLHDEIAKARSSHGSTLIKPLKVAA